MYLQGRYLVPVWTVPVAPVPVPRPVIPPGWTHITSPEARLSVLVPTTTVKEAKESNPPFTHTFSADFGRELFKVNTFEIAPQDLATARQNMESYVLSQHFDEFKIVSKRSFGLNGNPGIEINLSTNVPSNVRGTMRWMIIGNRLYTLTVFTESPERARIFFDSFRPLF